MGLDPADGLLPGSPTRIPSFAVWRRRLEDRLNRVPPGGAGLLVAPAGSGKSVLLSQWSAARPDLAVCSVALTPSHNDAVVFAAALLAAIRSVLPQFGAGVDQLVMTGGAVLGSLFVEGLIRELRVQPRDLVIVLDDAHVLDNVSLSHDLDHLIGNLPENSKVLIAARWDPPFRLMEMRMAARLVEIRSEELAFNTDEGRHLLTAVAGRELPDDQTESLVARTDGWAAGLQLAAISLQTISDTAAFVEAFAGTDRLVVEYLTEEVLDSQDEDTRRFLLSTSVLPWLTADLCDAVTGDDSGHELLALAASRSLFLVPLDRNGDRYRYHPLFADLLRYQLQMERPEDEGGLRRSAAGWFRSHGYPAEAIEQFLAADQPALAFDVVAEVGQRFFERGESATLVRWLSVIEQRTREAPASVGVNLLAAQVAAGESVAGAETYRQLGRRTDVLPGERAAADALYACLGLDDLSPEEVLKAAGSALELLGVVNRTEVADFIGIGGADSIETMAEFMSALAHFHHGDLDASVSGFDHARTLPGTQYVVWKINVLGAFGLARAWTGHLNEAQQLADAAFAAGAAAGVSNHQALVYAYFTRGLVALERHDLAAAVRFLADSGRRSQLLGRATVHHMQQLLDARLDTARNEPRQPLAALRQPSASGVAPPLIVNTRRALEAQLLVTAGQLPAARSILLGSVGAPGMSPVQIDHDLATGDVAAARKALDGWCPHGWNLTETVEHSIRTALVLESEGDHSAATQALLEAVARAEGEALSRPFLDVPRCLRLLATPARGRSPFVRSLKDAAVVAAARRERQSQLVEPLSDRELSVLEFLPSRLTNADIAAELFVSVNTVKTHVRNIYRKLDAPDRDAAVKRATDLGLL